MKVMKVYRKIRRKGGFTLIELLIVVAIIAILAAIAVPNFLEAQVRSKVSRAKADMRSLATAVESYYIDYNDFPYYPYVWDGGYGHFPDEASRNTGFCGLTPSSLTTPLAYMTSLPRDAFEWGENIVTTSNPQVDIPNPMNLYNYDSEGAFDWSRLEPTPSSPWSNDVSDIFKWVLVSIGPDLQTNLNREYGLHNLLPQYFQAIGVNEHYDPTNGSVSKGDIVYCGPGGHFGYSYTSSKPVY